MVPIEFSGDITSGRPTVHAHYSNGPLPLRCPGVVCGFAWGMDSPGARILAFAILSQAANASTATAHFAQFAREIIATLPPGRWRLTYTDIDAWLTRQERIAPRPASLFA